MRRWPTRWLLTAAAALAATCAASSAARGQEPARGPCAGFSGPMAVLNDAPLRQPFLRPRAHSACPAAEAGAELHFTAANQFVDVREGARSAFLDAETYQVEVAVALPLGDGREVRVAVPVRTRSGGFLDGAIERWHSIFGLPRGTRPDHPRNRIELLVEADSAEGGVLLSEGEAAAGLGDASVSVLQRLVSGPDLAAAARAALELPTGHSSDLLGSGALDGSLGLVLTARLAEPLRLHVNADLAVLGSSPLETEGLDQRHAVTQLLAALELRLGASTLVVVQAASDEAPLEVGIPRLDRRSLLVALGARRRLSQGLEVEGGFAEDLQVETAPDFTLHAGVRWVP